MTEMNIEFLESMFILFKKEFISNSSIKGITLTGSMVRNWEKDNLRYEFDFLFFIEENSSKDRFQIYTQIRKFTQNIPINNEIWIQFGFMIPIWKIRNGLKPILIFQFLFFPILPDNSVPYGFNQVYVESMKYKSKVIFGLNYLNQLSPQEFQRNSYIDQCISSIHTNINLLNEFPGSYAYQNQPLSLYHSLYAITKKNVIKIVTPNYYSSDNEKFLKISTNQNYLLEELKYLNYELYNDYYEFWEMYINKIRLSTVIDQEQDFKFYIKCKQILGSCLTQLELLKEEVEN